MMQVVQRLFASSNNQEPVEGKRKKRFDFTCGAGASDESNKSEIKQPDVKLMIPRISTVFEPYNTMAVKTCGITGRSLSQTVDTAFLPMRDLGDITVKYFDTRRFLGRGGKIRLFLRAKQIKHTYEALELTKDTQQDIIAFQQMLIETGGSPTGQLPILIHNNKTYCETATILRYLAKRIGEYGSDNDKDYVADMITDKLAYWTDDLMVAISEANTTENLSRTGCIYLKARPTYLNLFERLLELAGPSCTSTCPINTQGPSWFACALAATLFDDMQIISMLKAKNEVDLKCFPKLQTLFDEVMELPLVKEICLEKEIVRLSEEDPRWSQNYEKTDQILYDAIRDNTTASSSDPNNKKENFEYEIPMTRRDFQPPITRAQAAWMEQTTQMQHFTPNVSNLQTIMPGNQGLQYLTPSQALQYAARTQEVQYMTQTQDETQKLQKYITNQEIPSIQSLPRGTNGLSPQPLSWQRPATSSWNSIPMRTDNDRRQQQNPSCNKPTLHKNI